MPDPAPAPRQDDHVRWSEILTREHAPSLALVALAVWLHAATTLLLATMIDSILSDIGGERLVAWTVAVYLVGSIVAGSVAGLAAGRYGLRRPMAGAAALFALGCALNAVAPTMPLLLAGRLMEGLGGGGLMALAFVAVGKLFPPRLTARALAVVSTLWGASALLGPLTGGLFVEYASWRWGLWAFAGQAAALSVWIWLLLRREVPPRATAPLRLPLDRLALIAAGVALIAAAGLEPAPLRSSLCLLGGAGALWGALRRDARRGEGRLYPARAFRPSDPAGAALLMVLCMSFALVSFNAFAPVMLMRLHGLPPMAAGYVMAAVPAGWSTTAVLVSSLPPRHDPRAIAIGMSLVALSLPLLALVVPEGPPAAVAAVAAMEGAGFGLCWTFLLRRARAFAGPGDEARVAAAVPTTQQLGFAAGAAFAGLAGNAAGFAAGADPETLRTVARTVYLAPLPAVALGLWAMSRFVRARLSEPPGSRPGRS
ncbi:MAG: MFS transporter [Pseudomonadota bacterium]|nr:MFS transporter [Pseudomonadota bacterium]